MTSVSATDLLKVPKVTSVQSSHSIRVSGPEIYNVIQDRVLSGIQAQIQLFPSTKKIIYPPFVSTYVYCCVEFMPFLCKVNDFSYTVMLYSMIT